MKLKEYWPSWLASRRMEGLCLEQLLEPDSEPLPVIITLTSIPSRLPTIHLTIRSLLNQCRKAIKIVLWLHHDLEHQLPPKLRLLQGELFEIRYASHTFPHRKLIYSLEAFSDQILVTCDDDLIYDNTWLERLYMSHLDDDSAIIAHVCRRITRDNSGVLLPYKQWPIEQNSFLTSDNLLPIGYGGVLYPPDSLSKLTVDIDVFMRLAPKADDLWFRAMSWLQGTRVRCSHSSRPSPMPIIGSQKVSLLKANVRGDGNRIQWQRLCDYFEIKVDA